MSAFVAAEQNETTSSITREECLEIFNEFDADNSGSIDSSEFQAVACALGHVLSDGQVEEAMKELDTDGNGTIDFEEFFAWVCSDKANEKDASVAAWELAILKAKLSAFFYKKRAQNAKNRVVSRFLAASSGEPPAGSTSLSFNASIGDPPSDGLGIEIATLEPEADSVSVSMFITVREGASEEHVDGVIAVIKEGLQLVPLAQMVPGFEDLSVECVDLEGGRAIRLKLVTRADPTAALTAMGVQPAEVKPAFKVVLGSDLNRLFSGESCLRDMLRARVQASVVIPNSIKAVVKAMGVLPPKASWLLLMNHLELSIGVDDLLSWALINSPIGDDEQKVQLVNMVLDLKLEGFVPFVHSLVKLAYKTLQKFPPGAGPPVMQSAIANFDAFSCLDSLWGFKLNLPAIAMQYKVTGLNAFTLIPTAEERDAAAEIASTEIADIVAAMPEGMQAVIEFKKSVATSSFRSECDCVYV